MSVSYVQLKQKVNELEKVLIGRHLSKIIYFANDCFCCDLSRDENLIISLKGKDPFITTYNLQTNHQSMPSNFILGLKKEIANGLIKNIQLPIKDRIVEIELKVINSVFKEETRYLILELIPNKSNLLVLSEERKIILSFKKLSGDRLTIRNSVYEYPESTDFDESKLSSEEVDYEVKINELIENRKNEKFGTLISFVDRRIKISKKKIGNICCDIEHAKEHLNDNELGDLLFVHINEINKTDKFVEIEGRKIELNKKLSIAENAQSFYKRSKKAKTTIEQAEVNLKKAEKEFLDFTNLRNLIMNSNEDECIALFEEFSILDLTKKHKNNEDLQVFSSSVKPFQCNVDNTTIWFGKNAKQNDYLSFVADTSKKHLWMHIIGNSGAHLIIKDENPSQRVIDLCAQLLCYASKQVDGQVMITERKNIKKGGVPGLVNVSQYKTLRVNNVTQEAKELFDSATKI